MKNLTGHWLECAETQAVMTMLTQGGNEAFFVGGCVRNALMKVAINDVDIATNCHPKQVMTLAKNAGLKAIPTGIDHGTITVISGTESYEITTYRKDVETDGRRAVVAFSDNIIDDARRRDFTMNALYADANGVVSDPLGGLDDLAMRHVRFIDDANERIREDYLRSLRFFRFNAWYGDPKNGMDAEGLAAIAANLDGLETLSKERVGSEMLKLLAAPDPAPSIGAMAQSGVLARILPGADNAALAPLIHFENDEPNAIRRLAVLGGIDVADRLRLSRADTKNLQILTREIGEIKGPGEMAYRYDGNTARDVVLLRAAILETPISPDLEAQIARGASAQFPVTAADLMPELQGVELGKRLKTLENIWIKSNFQQTKQQLLSL